MDESFFGIVLFIVMIILYNRLRHTQTADKIFYDVFLFHTS